MQLGFEVVGAKTKKETGDEKPVQEPMRPVKDRRAPSTDQLKARRQLAKSAADSTTCIDCGKTVESVSPGWGKIQMCDSCAAERDARGASDRDAYQRSYPWGDNNPYANDPDAWADYNARSAEWDANSDPMTGKWTGKKPPSWVQSSMRRQAWTIADMQKIVDTGSYAKVDKQTVDTFSASAVIAVYNALNEENKAKLLSFGVVQAVDVAFKMLNKSKAAKVASSDGDEDEDDGYDYAAESEDDLKRLEKREQEEDGKKTSARSDYKHHGEDADAMWYQEEGRFSSEPEDDPDNGDADFYDDYAHDDEDDEEADADDDFKTRGESFVYESSRRGGAMNREAQILAALPRATEAEQVLLASELEAIRGARRANALGARESAIGSTMAAIHLTPVHGHVHHTASTDWLGEPEVQAPDRAVHTKASAEATLWARRVHAMVRDDRDEYLTQAHGYAQVWAGQFGLDAPSAVSSFMAMAAHLGGIRPTAGNPHAVGTPAWFDWEHDPDAEGKGPFDSGAPGGGIPIHGPLSEEQQAWMDKGRKKSVRRTADQGTGPSDDSQSGFGETGLDAVDVNEAPKDTNMGWIGGTNADETTWADAGDIDTQTATAAFVPAYMRQAMRLLGGKTKFGECSQTRKFADGRTMKCTRAAMTAGGKCKLHTLAPNASKTAGEGGATCATCGASIERDPEGESNRSWHHNDGSTHDHEAKPSSSKESRKLAGDQPPWLKKDDDESDSESDDDSDDEGPDDKDAPPDEDDSDDEGGDSFADHQFEKKKDAARHTALDGSGDDDWDPSGPGDEDGHKPAGAAPMVQPGSATQDTNLGWIDSDPVDSASKFNEEGDDSGFLASLHHEDGDVALFEPDLTAARHTAGVDQDTIVRDEMGRIDSFKCANCGTTVYPPGHGQDVDCDRCGQWYNASAQMLRDDWQSNPSNYDSEIGDMEGFEISQARREGARKMPPFVREGTLDTQGSLEYRGEMTKTAMPAPADVGVAVGDIFVNSWGYDQTNLDFYKVVRLTGAGVEVVPIGKKFVQQNGPGGNKVVADPDTIREWDTMTGIGRDSAKKSKVCRLRGDGGNYGPYIVLNSDHSASKWDGRPEYETDSMFGH